MIDNKNMCTIIFADNGKGIANEAKDRIFEEGFYYGATGHTGIGLDIVYKTIQGYGGSIKLEVNTASGATFIIKLNKV